MSSSEKQTTPTPPDSPCEPLKAPFPNVSAELADFADKNDEVEDDVEKDEPDELDDFDEEDFDDEFDDDFEEELDDDYEFGDGDEFRESPKQKPDKK